MSELKEQRALLEEARDRYQEQKHRDLDRWENEDADHFEKRKKKHRQRVKHLDKLVAHLKKKCEALAKAQKEKKESDDPDGDGLAIFDGKTVAAWMIPWLEKSRKAGWTGTVVSGYRDPAYSTQLCINMCGAPSCPGMCAGASSNHSGKFYPAGAVDVSDYTRFESIQWQIGSPLKNELDYRDPVHFSVSGN